MIIKPAHFLSLALLFPLQTSAAESGELVPACHPSDFNDNRTLQLADFMGKVVYVDFWASWCPTCKKSFPSLNRLHDELKQRDFAILAINVDEEKSDAEKFLHHNPVDFSIAYDGEGDCPRSFGVMAMPTSYIIDKNGIIRDVHVGFDDDSIDKIRTRVLSLLDE
ncbi:TlpA disulfide reductase family protein [Methylomarinum sp. Ch1-1]|uniref:TlpA disulfide reductase family protein n=1 Tax=Methylomarinum roseum TaxID=3067653 RepID=A0AAU7NW06_9GAMM|nr:TlpA disulfide reductase family protein [Methylomarinum sp. Ch1-1]MDP4522815.1 TlpA disulfide reductase family protein [Methylomarinum sp. Ch1-1]